VGWGLASGEGLALVTLYPVGSFGRTTILHAQVARPGMDWTNLLLGRAQGKAAVTGPIPDEADGPKARPLFVSAQARFNTAPSGTRPVSR
jgi:hypothetical protein